MIWFMFPRAFGYHFVRVPRAYGCQIIHAQTIIPLCSKSIRLPEHPCLNHTSSCSKSTCFKSTRLAKHLCRNQKSFVFQCIRFPEHPCQATIRFPRAFRYQSIHGQAMISFVFQEHRVTRASMPNHDLVYVSKSIRLPFRSCSKSIRLPEHPCPDHNSVVFQEHSVTRASISKP